MDTFVTKEQVMSYIVGSIKADGSNPNEYELEDIASRAFTQKGETYSLTDHKKFWTVVNDCKITFSSYPPALIQEALHLIRGSQETFLSEPNHFARAIGHLETAKALAQVATAQLLSEQQGK